jgi:hypothetical protein
LAGPILLFCASLLVTACESNRVPIVAETDDEAADFGRGALIEAVVTLSKKPNDAKLYQSFAARVEELTPLFNREVKREAELRLVVLAVAPLRAGFNKPQQEQMETLATTVWPSILKFPLRDGEDAQEYAERLCLSQLALVCNNVVPEYWPVILNAKVWRTLKSRLDVAYDRCRWCADDPSFEGVLADARESHLKIEMLAKDAQQVGRPSAWPNAGKNASPLATDFIVSFGRDGWVTIKDRTAPGGNWRQMIKNMRESNDLLGLHLGPARSVGDLLAVLSDVNSAGYRDVALVTRQRAFPYNPKQYVLNAKTKSFRDLGVHDSDTIQILVQALDLLALKRAGQKLN